LADRQRRVPGGETGQAPSLQKSNLALGGGTGALLWGGSGYGPDEDAWGSVGVGEWHVDVFEDGLGSDAFYTIRGLDEVVAGAAGLFAAESVGKNEWLTELTSTHQETGAIDGPVAFKIHGAFFHPSAGLGRFWLSGFWL